MVISDKTARALFAEWKAAPTPRFGHGRRAALVNVDLQRRYTDKAAFPATAYETDPGQLGHVNALAAACRARGFPVFWTYVAYSGSGDDALLWGVRSNGPGALQQVKHGSPMAEIDPRLERADTDIILHKRMASAFFGTHLGPYLTFHGIDTVVVTGGSTSGCVQCTVVDAMSSGFRTIVPEECVADRHESPHFSSLYNIATKYADVVPAAEALAMVRTMGTPADTQGARDAA